MHWRVAAAKTAEMTLADEADTALGLFGKGGNSTVSASSEGYPRIAAGGLL